MRQKLIRLLLMLIIREQILRGGERHEATAKRTYRGGAPMNYFNFAAENARRQAAFGTLGAYPREINEHTADDIILAALCQYFGGDALDEQEPSDTEVARALGDLDQLAAVLWQRYGRGEAWGDLANLIDRRTDAIRKGRG